MLTKLTSTLCALVLTGCGALTSHTPQDESYLGPLALTRSIQERYSHRNANSDTAPITTLVQTEENFLYTIETRTLDRFDANLERQVTVKFEHYQTKLNPNPPLVLIAPILGGKYAVERPLCELLAENGIDAVLVHRPRHMLKQGTYQTLETLFRSIVHDRRHVLDALCEQYTQMGSIGISMGAITNIPLIAVDKRLRYNILGLPGSNVPRILITSSEGRLEEFVEEQSQLLGKNEEELLEFFRQGFESDPFALAPYIDARNTRMFLAYFDTVVPYEQGLELYEALGRPELNVLPTGHYTTALYYFWVRNMVLEFFQERFGLDASSIERQKNSILRRHARRRTS